MREGEERERGRRRDGKFFNPSERERALFPRELARQERESWSHQGCHYTNNGGWLLQFAAVNKAKLTGGPPLPGTENTVNTPGTSRLRYDNVVLNIYIPSAAGFFPPSLHPQGSHNPPLKFTCRYSTAFQGISHQISHRNPALFFFSQIFALSRYPLLLPLACIGQVLVSAYSFSCLLACLMDGWKIFPFFFFLFRR